MITHQTVVGMVFFLSEFHFSHRVAISEKFTRIKLLLTRPSALGNSLQELVVMVLGLRKLSLSLNASQVDNQFCKSYKPAIKLETSS